MKHKIIEKSMDLFQSRGFSETSIQDVVDAIGVTKGTFYYYFDSKEQLLMEINTKYIDDLLHMQQLIVQDVSKSDRQKLYESIELLVKQIKTHGHLARIFFREMRNLGIDNLALIKDKREAFRIHLQEIVESGIRTGEFRQDLKADMITFGILGMCNWSYNWFHPDGPVSDHELTETFVDMVLHGIS